MARRSRKTDSRIFGPEAWAVVGGVELSHWDLWFLVVIRDLPGGKCQLVQLLKGRARSGTHDTEAKLSHLLDLETRLLAAGLTHDDVLGLVAIDKTLLRRALDKVIDQSPWRPSQAMLETPRRLLRDRAARGYWGRFPIDPATWEGLFGRLCRPEGDYGWRFTPVVAASVEHAWGMARLCASSASGRVAADRVTMTRIIDLMEHVDDSMADMSSLFEAVLERYLSEVWTSGLEPEVALRDGIELGVWEDYGLTDDMRPFLRSVPSEHVDLAIQIFFETTAELVINGLERACDTAHAMWATLLVAHARFAEFERLARRLGSDVCGPVVELAEAAMSAGRLEVARSVFAAADSPGPRREYLRQRCRELIGS